MLHRHLNHTEFTLAAVDDVICRGEMEDWLALRKAASADPAVLDRIRLICRAHVADPYAQRYHFWWNYAGPVAP